MICPHCESQNREGASYCRSCGGQLTDQPAIVVSVTHKVPSSDLAEQDIVPSELEGVPVDVQAIGLPRAL